MNAVAKAAGVGQGTLYRNFPTREALLAEVYRADVEHLVASAAPALERSDGITALRVWLDAVVEYAVVKRGVLAALEPRSGHELTASHAASIAAAVDAFLRAGRDDGTIRGDVDADDVVTLIGFLSRIDESQTRERAGRLLDVIVDGLRTRA